MLSSQNKRLNRYVLGLGRSSKIHNFYSHSSAGWCDARRIVFSSDLSKIEHFPFSPSLFYIYISYVHEVSGYFFLEMDVVAVRKNPEFS